jgi:hypothetical protein
MIIQWQTLKSSYRDEVPMDNACLAPQIVHQWRQRSTWGAQYTVYIASIPCVQDLRQESPAKLPRGSEAVQTPERVEKLRTPVAGGNAGFVDHSARFM